MATQITTNPDGTQTKFICEDCPNGYPPQKPLNAPAAPSGGSSSGSGWIFAAIFGALAIFALLFGLIDRKLSDKPPQIERIDPLPRDSGVPIS